MADQPNKKKIALFVVLGLLALGGSFVAGYSRRKVETKEVIKTVTQIQFQDRAVEKEKKVYVYLKAKDVVITKHEVKKPDGSDVIDTTYTDKTKTNTEAIDTDKKTDTKTETETQTTTVTKETKVELMPDWFVQVGAGLQINNPRLTALPQSGIYSLSVSRRIIWTCYGGAQILSDPLFNSPTALALFGCGF